MKVITPVRFYPLLPDISFIEEESNRLVQELPSYSSDKQLINLFDDHYEKSINYLVDISFNFLYKDEKLIDYLKNKHPCFKFSNTDYYLETDISLNLDTFDHRSLSKRNIILEVVAANDYLTKLCFLLNLTYATPTVFLDGIVLKRDSVLGYTDSVFNGLEFAYAHANKIGWPTISKLDVFTVIKWLNKHEINFYSISSSSVGRAINAFSYLINKDNRESDTSQLFWCMLGLEALYCTGISNLNEQLKQKTMLILGEPPHYKKKLNKLYDFRSRLIHGNINFPPKFSIDHEKFELEYWDYASFATTILLESIRTLIKHDLKEYKFSFNWDNKENNTT